MTRGAGNLELVSFMAEQELFRSFIQMSAIAAGWIDRDGNWLKVNSALCELSGYSEHEWLIPESIGPVLMMIGDRAVSALDCISEGEASCKVKMFHKKGCSSVELIWNEVNLPSGQFGGYLVQFKEQHANSGHNSERQQHSAKESKLEQALLLSKQHYKSLFDHHPDAVFSLDMQARFITLNSSCERITGYSANELFQTLFTNRIYPEDSALTFKHFRQAAEGQAQDFTTRVLHKNGSIIEFRIYLLPILVDGNTKGVYGIAQDITQEKRLMEKLRMSQDMYKLIEENSFDLLVRCSLNGIVLYLSPSCKKLLGYDQHELLGMSTQQFIHPEDLVQLEAQYSLQYENKQDSTLYSFRFQHKDGYYVWMETMISLIREFSDGAVSGLLCVSRDISERKQTEELILRSEKLTMAGQLAAGIAHEIRNPLTSIKGFLQLLSSQVKDKQEYIGIMQSELNRIEEITSELLLLAKPHEKSFRQQELNSLLKQVVTIMEPQAILNNVQIMSSFPDDCLFICCDENQLKQVFVNFIKNAIEAMPNGGDLEVILETQFQDAIVSIVDQGCGIPPEKLASIWQPFYTTKVNGTGLGLMVSYSIIENHKGMVLVTSEMGVGSTFSVRIPLLQDR
jgi:two-component system, sporulation sensor kinase A